MKYTIKLSRLRSRLECQPEHEQRLPHCVSVFHTGIAKPWTMARRNRHEGIAGLSISNRSKRERELAESWAEQVPRADAIHGADIHFLDQCLGWVASSRWGLCDFDSKRHCAVRVPLRSVTQRQALACGAGLVAAEVPAVAFGRPIPGCG